MPDIIVESDVRDGFYRKTANRYVVWVNPSTCYVFYVDNVDLDLEYRKTINGGLTWTAGGTPIKVRIGAVTRVDVWYDKWTPGDSGTIIHIVSQDSIASTIQYISLDTSDDSLTVAVTIALTATTNGNNRNDAAIGITKARGNGFLYTQWWATSTGVGSFPHAFFQSDDGGATWTEKADGADGDPPDGIQLLPGNEADSDDIWMIYWDRSAEEISLKVFDFSGDSWSETLISAGMIDNVSFMGMMASIRHSDNHAILVAFNEFDVATADLKAWDIGSSASITALTDVLTNNAESYFPCILINQQNDDIYVGYAKGTTLNVGVDIKYKLSTDGGTTWEAQQDMSEDAEDDHRYVESGLSIDNAGGKFQPIWENDDTEELITNVNNGVTIPAVVSPVGAASLPEYGQIRTAIGDPAVYGATILRS